MSLTTPRSPLIIILRPPGSKHHLADAARRLVFRGTSHRLEGPCGASDPLLQVEAELLDTLLTSATLLVGADEGWLHHLNQCHFNPPGKKKSGFKKRCSKIS